MVDTYRSAVLASAACALTSLVTAAAQAQPATLVASAAYGVQASFTGGGMSTSLGPVAPVSGSAPPAYAKTVDLPAYSGAVAIPPLVPDGVIYPIVASLTVDASQLVSHVASPGLGVDDISATGGSSIEQVQFRIANTQPVPTPVSPEFLRVVATGVAASASYDKVLPIAPVVTGTASFGSLTIAGSLLGGAVVTYAGTAPANTVLYRSATVTITVDQQVRAVLATCPPCTPVVPADIVVHALDITFDNAIVDGRSFSGEIVVGDASAGG